MKTLFLWFERARPLFEAEGRFRLWKPVFDATEAFFFAPAVETAAAPHIRDALDVKRFMTMAILGLGPCVAAGLYFFGLRLLAMIAVSYVVGGAVEVGFAVVRREAINEGFLVTGLIFPLVLPPGLPLWMVGVGIGFGVVVGKELFGGTGRNLFNPALVGRCFLGLAYPGAMSSNWIAPGRGGFGRLFEYAGSGAPDAVATATPLILARQGHWVGLADLITGRVAGSAGETSALAVVVGGVFLILVGVASVRTVLGLLGSFWGLEAVLHAMWPANFEPATWALCAGGVLFGAFFMATDPVSSPLTRPAKWGYGAVIGVAAVLIRNLTGYVEGVMFAILLGNIWAPLLDEAAIHLRMRRLCRAG